MLYGCDAICQILWLHTKLNSLPSGVGVELWCKLPGMPGERDGPPPFSHELSCYLLLSPLFSPPPLSLLHKHAQNPLVLWIIFLIQDLGLYSVCQYWETNHIAFLQQHAESSFWIGYDRGGWFSVLHTASSTLSEATNIATSSGLKNGWKRNIQKQWKRRVDTRVCRDKKERVCVWEREREQER